MQNLTVITNTAAIPHWLCPSQNPFAMMASFWVPCSNCHKRVLAQQNSSGPEAGISNWESDTWVVILFLLNQFIISPGNGLVLCDRLETPRDLSCQSVTSPRSTSQRGKNGSILKQNVLHIDNRVYVNHFLGTVLMFSEGSIERNANSHSCQQGPFPTAMSLIWDRGPSS